MEGKRFISGFSKEMLSAKWGTVRTLIEGLCSTACGTEEWLSVWLPAGLPQLYRCIWCKAKSTKYFAISSSLKYNINVKGEDVDKNSEFWGEYNAFDYLVFHTPLLSIDWRSLKKSSALNQHAVKWQHHENRASQSCCRPELPWELYKPKKSKVLTWIRMRPFLAAEI